jgi:hypothetical protein
MYGYYNYDYNNKKKIFNKQGYFYLNKNNSVGESLYFRKGVFTLNLIRYNLKKYVSIIEIEYKEEKMYIYAKFDQFFYNSYNIYKFNIYFQEGVYEITDADNPQLIPIKNEEL